MSLSTNKRADSLISLDLIGLIIADLNEELQYQAGEFSEAPPVEKFLTFQTNGEKHRIYFLGAVVWDSEIESLLEQVPVEKELTLNERPHFEGYLRKVIMDKLNILKSINL